MIELLKKEQIITSIEELPELFIGTGEVKGFKFSQVKKHESVYIYQVDVEGKFHFEVFERKLSQKCIDFKNRVYSETESKEIYPKAKNFGIWAWTYPTYQQALGKFREMSVTIPRITNDRNNSIGRYHNNIKTNIY
jgi:hypothetical protein